MIYIGYILKDNKPLALTYGSEENMLAWKQLNLLIYDTTDLFILPDGEDPDLCLEDNIYFNSLL